MFCSQIVPLVVDLANQKPSHFESKVSHLQNEHLELEFAPVIYVPVICVVFVCFSLRCLVA